MLLVGFVGTPAVTGNNMPERQVSLEGCRTREQAIRGPPVIFVICLQRAISDVLFRHRLERSRGTG